MRLVSLTMLYQPVTTGTRMSRAREGIVYSSPVMVMTPLRTRR